MAKGAKGTGTGDPKVRAEFLEDIASGESQASAAAKHKLDARSFRSRAQTDEEFAQAFAEAKNEGASERADLVDKRFDEWVLEPDCAPALRIVWAKRWHPAYREAARVEHTGPGGGPVQIEDRSASLQEVARVLEAVGALAQLGSGASGDEVPDARTLLAEPQAG